MTQDELKMVLEFVESINLGSRSASVEQQRKVITAIEEALAQPEQEPVATVTSETGVNITMSWWHEPSLPVGTKLYTHPPQNVIDKSAAIRIATALGWKPKRTWVGLTEQEHTDIAVECGCMSADWVFYGAAVERKVKERNT